MKLIFFGSTLLSCRVLKSVLGSRHEVVGVVTQPDQPAGRKMNLCETEVCSEAQTMDLPIFKPAVIRNNRELRSELRALKPEAFLTASYGKIISRKTLELVEFPLNVHPSQLPRLRGASPARTALLQGLAMTGCCIMRMTPRMDDGDIVLRREQPIDPGWNYQDLLDVLGQAGGEMAVEALDLVESGRAEFTPQDHEQATYCSIYQREDTVIDWGRSTGELLSFVRAWDPDIGACTALPDGRRLKIWKVSSQSSCDLGEPDSRSLEPGTIAAAGKKAFWVATGDGTIRVDEVQPENKQRMPAANFLAGNRLAAGELLGSISVC